MRISSGSLGGREVRVPAQGARPTQDKVRAAIFNAIAALVPGARVLDLFAGSGALGLEAWSRGAASVCWVEANRRNFAVLQENVRRLCTGAGGQTQCLAADALRFLQHGPVAEPFDVILADPPYDREGQWQWLGKTLQALAARPILKCDGLLIFEQSAGEPVVAAEGWTVVRDRTYGETRVLFYRRTS